jgi:hypothetical protein
MTPEATTVVISPHNVVDFPDGGGHFWVYMQYALGLRALGCRVYWLESVRRWGPPGSSTARIATFLERMEGFGLSRNVILYAGREPGAAGGPPVGRAFWSHDSAEAIIERADLLLNFHYAISPALLARFRRTALVDIDPGLLQFWIRSGQLHVPRHDICFTIGEGIAGNGDGVPGGAGRWHPIRPPVSLEHWGPAFDPACDAFTAVSIWDSDDYVVDRDVTYANTKRDAFLEFADLPRMTDQRLELALFLRTRRDRREKAALQRRGWAIRHSREVASSPESYRAYIQGSRGEFGWAKPSYVRLRTGWVSDRTACYLASGKPVVVQDTGPSAYLPSGEGMFRFSTAADAARSLAAINADYERHARAARALAETHFDARQVLRDILTKAID